MNRGRLILIASGIAAVIVVVILAVYGLQRNQQTNVATTGVTYTDSISGQKSLGFPQTGSALENGSPDTPPLNQVTITGLDDFFGTIDQDQARSILNDLTSFVRAHVGARGTRAGALNAKITTVKTSPAIYQFTLVMVDPEARYSVTITMPNNQQSTTAQVTFGEVSQ